MAVWNRREEGKGGRSVSQSVSQSVGQSDSGHLLRIPGRPSGMGSLPANILCERYRRGEMELPLLYILMYEYG